MAFHISPALLLSEAACRCKWWAVTLLPKAGSQCCFLVWREPSRRLGRVENLLEGSLSATFCKGGNRTFWNLHVGRGDTYKWGLRCSGLQGDPRSPQPVSLKLWQNQEPGCHPKGPGGLCGIQPPRSCRLLGNREESWRKGFVLLGASLQEGEICF